MYAHYIYIYIYTHTYICVCVYTYIYIYILTPRTYAIVCLTESVVDKRLPG